MNFHTMTADDAVKYIHSLTPDTRKKNKLNSAKRPSLIKRFFMQFSDFMIIILLIAAGISFFVSLIGKDSDFADPIIILSIVVLNAVLGVIEESRADNAIEALKKISAPMATIRRGEKIMTVNSENVRVGDTLILQTGNAVSADARLIRSVDLETDESSLTGEAMPVLKDFDKTYDEFTPLAERRNMIYAGTSVIQGKAEAIVTAIGMDTEMGKIASLLDEQEDEETPLQQSLAETSKYLGIGALAICAVIFVMGILKKYRHLQCF